MENTRQNISSGDELKKSGIISINNYAIEMFVRQIGFNCLFVAICTLVAKLTGFEMLVAFFGSIGISITGLISNITVWLPKKVVSRLLLHESKWEFYYYSHAHSDCVCVKDIKRITFKKFGLLEIYIDRNHKFVIPVRAINQIQILRSYIYQNLKEKIEKETWWKYIYLGGGYV